MSTYSVYIKANLYSVHWENDKEHGYFRQHIRVLAKDAVDAIEATRPLVDGAKHADKIYAHVVSVDMLAEGIRILPSQIVLEESCVHNLYQPSTDYDLTNLLKPYALRPQKPEQMPAPFEEEVF